MKWFMPTWNGDLRLVPDAADPDVTLLSIVKPTAAEAAVLRAFAPVAVEKKWTGQERDIVSVAADEETAVRLLAPIATIGPVIAKLLRPGDATLTAITFKDGRCITCSGTSADLAETVAAVAKEAEKAPEEEKPKAAATVKRPTPCCPECIPGAIGPATEALLAFLTPEQHARWAAHREIIVEGQLSGHRYLIAHRHTERAQAQSRICWDLDDDGVMHFHDQSVPPEEEVLAAKLILEHCEPWLRNEATAFGLRRQRDIYKNPFGGGGDGVPDSMFVNQIGRVLQAGLGLR